MNSEILLQMKNLFYQTLKDWPVKQNSVLITSVQKYDQLICEVERAQKNLVKTSTDLRRINRYDVLLLAGEKKLIEKRTDDADNTIRYFVHNDELFDVIHKVHIQSGHGGRNKLEKKSKKTL